MLRPWTKNRHPLIPMFISVIRVSSSLITTTSSPPPITTTTTTVSSTSGPPTITGGMPPVVPTAIPITACPASSSTTCGAAATAIWTSGSSGYYCACTRTAPCPCTSFTHSVCPAQTQGPGQAAPQRSLSVKAARQFVPCPTRCTTGPPCTMTPPLSLYHQCGGKNFNGHTICASPQSDGTIVGPVVCSSMNEWYSQCVFSKPPVNPIATPAMTRQVITTARSSVDISDSNLAWFS